MSDATPPDGADQNCPPQFYAIALGSNKRHPHFGDPRGVLRAAISTLDDTASMSVIATAPIVDSAPIGPSLRRYANSAAIIETPLSPPDLLATLKAVERQFGQRRGQRWAARVLDLDIILWSGGIWDDSNLSIPHRHWRERRFVTDPLCTIAPGWRDPLCGLTVQQIAHRLCYRKGKR